MSGEPPRPWRVESSRHILEDRWISLRADRCVTQRGAVLDPYYVFEYRDWAHVAAFDDDDRLILVRQYRHGAGVLSLELPGGVVDPHETAVAAGARELLEETGHEAASFEPLARLSPNPATHTNHIHVILATGARVVRPLRLDATEDLQVELVPWRRALDMALGGEMIHAQHVGLLLVALARAKGVRFGGETK